MVKLNRRATIARLRAITTTIDRLRDEVADLIDTLEADTPQPRPQPTPLPPDEVAAKYGVDLDPPGEVPPAVRARLSRVLGASDAT